MPNAHGATPKPGGPDALVGEVLTRFAPRFAPRARPIYVGAGDAQVRVCDAAAFVSLGAGIPPSAAMPAVVLHDVPRGWLFLVEAAGPVDGERIRDCTALFGGSTAGLVFVTACTDWATYTEYDPRIAWGTHVWVAAEPDHMIHYDRDGKLLGPRGASAHPPAIR